MPEIPIAVRSRPPSRTRSSIPTSGPGEALWAQARPRTRQLAMLSPRLIEITQLKAQIGVRNRHRLHHGPHSGTYGRVSRKLQ